MGEYHRPDVRRDHVAPGCIRDFLRDSEVCAPVDFSSLLVVGTLLGPGAFRVIRFNNPDRHKPRGLESWVSATEFIEKRRCVNVPAWFVTYADLTHGIDHRLPSTR